MNDYIIGIIMIIGFVLFSIAGFYIGNKLSYSTAYKQGQIDYANGVEKYKLEEQEDKSIIWVKR